MEAIMSISISVSLWLKTPRLFIVIIIIITSDNPLTEGFNIAQGNVSFICPKVSPGKDYIIACESDMFSYQDSGPRLISL